MEIVHTKNQLNIEYKDINFSILILHTMKFSRKKKKLHTVEFAPPWETNWNKIILDSLPKEYNNVMKWSAHTAWTPTKISHIPTQRMPNIIDAGI